ncbi:MAG: TetR/AcrR family transcriptional regulator [Vicinamibacteria bacterium]|jgi:TetR/AcrR family transcriptional regulator|nr:TetR/AcrR family transcriptional regulator [Vicinamibacteria bacterium]
MARIPVTTEPSPVTPVAVARRPVPRRRRERRDPAATREALLQSGAELFALGGFDGVSTDDLARHSGVNKAMISYHFGGKLGLYRAILAHTFEPIRERVVALRSSGQPAPDALREFIAAFGEVASQRHPAFPSMLVRELLTPGSPAVSEILPYLVDVVGTVRHIVDRGIRGGQFREVDPLMTHLSMVGALAFFFATGPARARILASMPASVKVKAPDADAFVRHMQDLMTLGLAKRPGRS